MTTVFSLSVSSFMQSQYKVLVQSVDGRVLEWEQESRVLHQAEHEDQDKSSWDVAGIKILILK